MNNRKWLVLATLAIIGAAFAVGAFVYQARSDQAMAQAAQGNSDALVRPHSPVFGSATARVTIVEFFDPSCEACRAFYPLVKGIVNASFGQVRLVLRYAPLHQGSDTAVQILEAARVQGKYWQALERTLAAQPQWAAHHSPQPAMIWDLIGDLGLGHGQSARRRRQPGHQATADAGRGRHESAECRPRTGLLCQWNAVARLR